MTVTVSILVAQNGHSLQTHQVIVSETALAAVRHTFNPSGSSEVETAKLLAAAAITQMEPVRDARGEGGRCAAIAVTGIEQAAMWAVKAVTAEK